MSGPSIGSTEWVAMFWSRADRSGGGDVCWPWMGCLSASGYGKWGKESSRAHRVAWEIVNGAIPDTLRVCHRCDNRACVNPAHLFLGTDADNLRDRDTKGRGARGERVGTARLTAEQVAEIRRRVAAGESRRSLARTFGVGNRTVQEIANRKRWAHIPEPIE